MAPPQHRRFLFLQGPHGPFFAALAARLRAAGAGTERVAFTAGDAAFWWPAAGLLPWRAPAEAWEAGCGPLMAARGTTDLVLYGDARPLHAAAIAAARARGITVHVFEEGYLRPFWATYERGGANGASRLMEVSLAQMAAALAARPAPGSPPRPPAHWGEMRAHMAWGAAYHAALVAGRARYPAYRPHRATGAGRELGLHLRRLAGLPLSALARARATAALAARALPTHVLLMQLAHDASLQAHGPFATQAALLKHVVAAFAAGAPAHHLLAVKAHPLEDHREPLRPLLRRIARAHGVADRVVYLPGGKLARVLDIAASAVTVTSTAAQQALWRGLPTAALGRAVYARPGLVSQQPLPAFFARPEPPDPRACATFRAFLLATSQLRGGYYTASGRAALIRSVVDRMLAARDPYDALLHGTDTGPALHLVAGAHSAPETESPRQQVRPHRLPGASPRPPVA